VGNAGHTVAAGLLALLLVACTRQAAPEQSVDAGTHTPPAPSAVLVSDCWVPTAGGNVAFSGDEARALTTRAGQLGRRTSDGAAVAGRLTAAVLAAAPEAGRDRAADVAGGLAGVPRANRLVCGYARSAAEPQRPAANGLVPRANLLRTAWTRVFGTLPAGGFAPGGVSTGHVDGSAHYEGRAMDVFFRPLGDDEQRRRGWVFAQWVLAHAPEHQVLSVIYDDHIWTSWAAGSGWRDHVHPGQTFAHRSNVVLRHLDHVHVAVESGEPFTG
jgi:hypothetical protein